MLRSTQHAGAEKISVLLDEEIQLLYEECSDKLNDVEHDLMDVIDRRSGNDLACANRVFRAFHSIKAAADLVGDDPLKRLSTAAENVLGAIRAGQIHLAPDTAGSLLSAVDQMKQRTKADHRSSGMDAAAEIVELNHILSHCRNAAGMLLELGPEDQSNDGSRRLIENHQENSSRRLKVLIVEDDFTSRVILQGLLRAYGECHVAVNGKEAVDAFAAAHGSSEPYHLICMDIHLPEMDGTEAVRQIRSLEEQTGILSTSGVKILMTTAITDLKTVHSSYRALCDGYLFKPVDGRRLEEHMLSFGLISRCGLAAG
jgi:two-component system, chemotaxis family, chemotaxis protein CheY